MNLIEKITKAKNEWRDAGYPCEKYPNIKYILEYNYDPEIGYRFLRPPQFEALEIYWYLRLNLNTPSFFDLYKYFYPKNSELCEALGVGNHPAINRRLIDGEELKNILSDEEFAQTHRLENIHESMSLPYASYILALTMGAGKTILIASIIATEFAMSLEYNGDNTFMKNALVSAPYLTIIESLKEISDTPFDKILPPNDYQAFMTNMKLIYPQVKTKDIGGLIPDSSYNIIVTNTQKIITKKIPKNKKGIVDLDMPYQDKLKKEQSEYAVNLRLQRIASLPSIGIFSDEAHHTYGNKVGDELKRVRETINYIGNETNIICVVNTTGTPYSKRQILKDVVYWYGLQEGIKDNILKSLENSIVTYNLAVKSEETVLENVINNFFDEYDAHTLPNGAPAKIAFYFKNKAHLAECRLMIEGALIKKKISPSLILQNTEDATSDEKDEFNSLNNPDNQKRVILLVNIGTEGWNCPSLFATALIREVKSSDNFILQSSTRCLRQVAGNTKPARIYIESKNKIILENELIQNFGTSLGDLTKISQEYDTHTVTIKKPNPPRLEIIKIRKEIITTKHNQSDIQLTLPIINNDEDDVIYKTIFQPNLNPEGDFLGSAGLTEKIQVSNNDLDIFTATKDIARNYHLNYLSIFNQLQKLYPDGNIPKKHIFALCKQIDNVQNDFEVRETKFCKALALIKTQDEMGNDVFEKDENGFYCHTIRYQKGRRTYILADNTLANNEQGFGFHYAPYHFDSEPEQDFFISICESLNTQPDEIEDIYFTGGLTSAKYTDFAFEYKNTEGKYSKYYPDFVVLKKTGEFIIVEVKGENQRGNDDVEAKKKAVQQIENIAGNKFKYHILYADTPIPAHKIYEVEQKIFGEKT